MPENVEGEWRVNRFSAVGFGRSAYGSAPYGNRAATVNLGTLAFPQDTLTDGENASSSWVVSTDTASWDSA